MRIRVVIPLLLAGFVIVLLPFVTRRQNAALSNPEAPAISAGNALTSGDVSRGQNEFNHQSALAESNLPGATITTAADAGVTPIENHEDYVNRRIAELEDLGLTGDASSLINIESELDNRDPRIQAAAVSAAIQFGSRDAIPALREAYDHTDDPTLKLRLQKAIEFLELPTESETTSAANPPANTTGNSN